MAKAVWGAAATIIVVIFTAFCTVAVDSNSVGFHHALLFPAGVVVGLIFAALYMVVVPWEGPRR